MGDLFMVVVENRVNKAHCLLVNPIDEVPDVGDLVKLVEAVTEELVAARASM